MIKVIAIGKCKERALIDLVNDYKKRIKYFHAIEIMELAEYPDNKNVPVAIKQESLHILRKLKDQDYMILLDLAGEDLDSLAFAGKMATLLSYPGNICFVIGGSNGVSQELKNRADYQLRLSALTFPHQIARLILLEQLYRSFKINTQQTYHK